MPISRLNSTYGSGNSSAVSPAFDTTGANLLVVAITAYNPGGVLSDTYGNTWLPLGAAGGTQFWYAPNAIVGPGHTASVNSNFDIGVYLMAYSGANSMPLGPQNSATRVFSTNQVQPGVVSPASNGALIITAFQIPSTVGVGPFAIDSGFTIINQTTGFNGAFSSGCADLIQPTAAPVNPIWSQPGLSGGEAVIAVFYPASSGISTASASGTKDHVAFGIAVSTPGFSTTNASGTKDHAAFGITVATPTRAFTASSGEKETSVFSIAVRTPTPGLVPSGTIESTSFGVAVGSSFGAVCPFGVAYQGAVYNSPVGTSGDTKPDTYRLGYGVFPSNLNVVCLGDSLTVGYPVAPAGSYPTQLAAILGAPVTNVGFNGAQSAYVLSSEVAAAEAAFVGGKTNIALVLMGINDIMAGPGMLPALQNNAKAVVSNLRGFGFAKVYFLTLTPSSYSTQPANTLGDIAAHNTWLLAGSSGADGVCNSGQDPTLASPLNLTYYQNDYLHMTAAGYGVVAQNAAATIFGTLPPGLVLGPTTGVISGVPVTVGNYPYAIQITDAQGNTAFITCAIMVGSSPGATTGFIQSATYQDDAIIVTFGGNSPEPIRREFFVSAVGNFTVWSPLDFGTKDANPDPSVAVVSFQQILMIFGLQTLELWYNAGNGPAAGYARIQGGGVLYTGLASPWAWATWPGAIAWIGADATGALTAWMMRGQVPVRISNHAVEFQWKDYDVTGASAHSYQDAGHQFVRFDFPVANATWLADVSTLAPDGKPLWHQRGLWNGNAYAADRGRTHAYSFPVGHVVGDYTNGNLYLLSTNFYDDNGTPLRWLRSSPHTFDEVKRVFFSRLRLYMQTGISIPSGGPGSAPVINLRISNDGGFTWGPYLPMPAGVLGATIWLIEWLRLGYSRNRVYELTGSDPIPIALVDCFSEALEQTSK